MKSEAQITLERKAWARGKLLVAWRRVENLAQLAAVAHDAAVISADRALRDAVAIAQEWGVDCTEAAKAAEK